MKKIWFSLVLMLGIQLSFAQTQTQKHYTSDAIYKKIQKLNFLGSVLYVGAHPDDENTAMISHLSNETNARVGYLSMTRGDGGQNILGSDIRELLGVIRTQELLAARDVDGGEQFFTRANDFGFSKNPEETFEFWDKDKVLSDVVWTFRKFRPDVVIDRFDHREGSFGKTHGHHTASAILSNEAFDLSAKEDKYPDQLQYYPGYQPKKLYTNVSWMKFGEPDKWEDLDKSGFLKVDLGQYSPILGRSNSEIAAESRSQHKSQGMGMTGERGEDLDYFERIKGDFPDGDHSVFAGMDTTWNRVNGGKKIGKLLKKVEENFDFKDPGASLPNLVKAYNLIKDLDDSHWRTIKSKEIKEIIAASAGLHLEATTDKEFGTHQEELDVTLEAINRSDADIELRNVDFSTEEDVSINGDLNTNENFEKTIAFSIPKDLDYTNAYWLKKPHTTGMYRVDDQELIGLPETPPQITTTFHLIIEGTPIDFERDLVYKTNTPVQGEVKEPFAIVPEVSVAMRHKALVFGNDSTREIKVDITPYKDSISGTLVLNHPDDWEVSPQEKEVALGKSGDTKTITFSVIPPDEADEGQLNPEFKDNGEAFTKQLHVVAYPHIPTQTVLLPAKTKINRADIKTKGEKIAYINGAGDKMPESLEQIGYQVDVIKAADISLNKLKNYDAVVIGIRAYDVDDAIVIKQNELFDYVKQGGTLVTQYNTTRELKTDKVAPYELHLSHDRVTDEDSEVKFLAEDHPVLNRPNKITTKDFEGWVQERGLYFPDEWSDEYTEILGMHDKDEDEMAGSLLTAQFGEGHFVYTGLSFFRELPAGVPGAYRLFANILAL